MPNEYYDSTGAPANNSLGNPALIRAEFDAIETGFAKLPPLATHANEAVFVNAGATALESLTAANARTRLGAEASANKDASGGFVGLTLLKINFKNVLDTFTSFLTNSNTASRTYTFPDSDGTIALTTDMPLNGRKNWIINGDFRLWRRNTSHTVTGYGSDDRWYVGSNGTTFTNSRQEFSLGQTDVPDQPRYYCRLVTVSAAGAANYCNKEQRIEGVHVLAGTSVTLSFYAKSSVASNISVEFVQNFGTGGAPSATVTGIEVNKIAITTNWAQYTVTASIPSIAGKTLGTDDNDYMAVIFWVDAGADFNARTDTLGQSSNTYEFSHVQLEIGSSSTEFERRMVGEELELCQRYFLGNSYASDTPRLAFSGDVTTATDYIAKGNFPVAMRIAPTVTLTHSASSRFDAVAGTAVVTSVSVEETRTSTSTGSAGYFVSTYTADAEL